MIPSYLRLNGNESYNFAANPLLRPGSAINSPSTAPQEPPPGAGLFGILHLAFSSPGVHLTSNLLRVPFMGFVLLRGFASGSGATTRDQGGVGIKKRHLRSNFLNFLDSAVHAS